MTNSHQSIDNLLEIYHIVKDRDFIVKDIPAEMRPLLRKLELQGYIIRSGSVKLWFHDRYKDYPTYRIASRYLQRFCISD